MNGWPFVTAAYVIAVGGTLALILSSLVAMRRAEGDADATANRPRR